MEQFQIVIYQLGIIGMLINRKEVLKVLLSMELIICGQCNQLVIQSLLSEGIEGQIGVIMVMSIGASESALGLGMVLQYERRSSVGDIKVLRRLKG